MANSCAKGALPGQIRVEIPASFAGERLDRALAQVLGYTRALLAEAFRSGSVLVEGRRVKPSFKLRGATEVSMVLEQDQPELSSSKFDLAVVYEDCDLVVVDKPAGIAVHPGAGRSSGTLLDALVSRYPEITSVGDPTRPGIVHRLDLNTSGLLVVARSELAYRSLVEQLAKRTASRRYEAAVVGHMPARRGTIEGPIGRSRRKEGAMAVRADGKSARTHYEVIAESSDPIRASLLAVRLETGRTHQIRVHLSALGRPVAGDATYGGARRELLALGLARPYLHAVELKLIHPRTGQEMAWHSELPPELHAVAERLFGARRDVSG